MLLGLSAFSLFLLAAQVSSTSGGRVSGRVTDATSGAPISGARVTFTMVVDVPGATFGGRPRQSATDANGAFAFDGLEPGPYILNVDKTGFASYPDVLGDGLPERLTVDANHEDPQLQIALKKGAVITGRILNAAGEPQADLDVSALRRTDKVGPLGFAQNGNARTNDLGEFRMAGLAAGDYLIVASVRRDGPFEAVQTGTTTTFATTYFPGTLDQKAARVMTLAPGQTATGIEFAIVAVAAFHVSGIVVDQTGRPSPGAMVMIMPDLRTGAPFAPMMSIAADDGTFTIGDVGPGTYRMMAHANPDGAAGGIGAVSFGFTANLDGSLSGPGIITVGSADVNGLTVVADGK
jgi:Carboxypeptidase regulatory-like domain